MEVFRNIILSGNIKNKDKITSHNMAVNKLELIPNIGNDSNEPVCFYIKFLVEDMLIELNLILNLGGFAKDINDRNIIEEELRINYKVIYRRTESIEIGKMDTINDKLIDNFSREAAEMISQSNLDKQELFFNGLFKTLYSKKVYDIIIKWFEEKFNIIYRIDKLEIKPILSIEDKRKKFFVDKRLNEVLKKFGLTSDNIAFPVTENEEQIIPLSMVSANGKEIVLPAEYFESFGTIRFLNIFPMIFGAIENGYTLIIDELDASIHPMAIMNIINIFHNDEINTKGAQLIFNTHNPIFLNNALFRRDEIKFVEKENESSTVYSLADFGTSGEYGVRKNEDYMKNYFINKYGAIKQIDFSSIFINSRKEENNEKKTI